MDNNFLQNNFPNNNPPAQNQSIWISNPHLKMLLLVLIFVFLGCGIGLAVFSQWSSQYRQQVYEETQAGLPVHIDKPIATTTQSSDLIITSKTPTTTASDITSWKTYKNAQYGFEFQYPSDSWAMDDLKDFNSIASNVKTVVSLFNVDSFNAVAKCHCGEITRFQIIVTPVDNGQSSANFAKAIKGFNPQTIKVSGIDAIEAGEMDRAVFFIKGNLQYQISPIEKILSTFKFTK